MKINYENNLARVQTLGMPKQKDMYIKIQESLPTTSCHRFYRMVESRNGLI